MEQTQTGSLREAFHAIYDVRQNECVTAEIDKNPGATSFRVNMEEVSKCQSSMGDSEHSGSNCECKDSED